MATTTMDQPKAAMRPLEDLGAYGSARWLLLLGFVLAAILEVLDTSIINPVLATMAGSLGCTTQEIGWVSTSYILANVVVLPMTAWFARRFGLKGYLLTSIAVFIGASVMCGLVHSLGQIILWRLLQGAAGAPLISMTQAAIAEVFPKREQTIAQSVWALGITVAPSLAPALGGWIADNYAWPWIFFINVPMGLAAMYVVGSMYKGAGPARAGRVDWLGIGLLAAGLGSIQYVLEEGQSNDWMQNALIARLVWLGVSSTALFVVWQLSKRNTAPIVDLRVLADRGLSGAVVVSFICGFGLYAGLFLFPLFAQAVLGFTPYRSGMFMLIPGTVLAVAMISTGMSMEKGIPGRDLAMLGAVVMMVAMWRLGHLTPMSNESDAQFGLDIRGLGIALMLLSVTVAGVAGLKASAVSQGAALLGLARQLGGSFGIALSSTYVVQMTAFHRYNLAANLYQGNPLAEDRLNMFAGAFYAKGMDMEHARAAAASVLDGQISQQAYTLAIDNAHIGIGVLFFLTIPCLFLMKRRAGVGEVSVH